jgi:3-hydroxyisobutyrate dehydrogenase-like beta-hydroxyacid dehydrogenase
MNAEPAMRQDGGLEERDPRVTVIGTGMLGSAVADALLAAGHPTTVWNRSANKTNGLAANGARRATTLDDAVAASPLVLVCLSTYEVLGELLEPLQDGLSGRVLVNLSSGTPKQARDMASWAAKRGAEYLDAAAMSGTRLIGQPEALFLFSGAPKAFASNELTLRALGNATDLGADPGLASLYDTALFGLAWSTLAGFYHGLALVGAEAVDPTEFASVATSHLPFLGWLAADHARQIEAGHYPGADGTVEVHAAAMDHLIETSRAHSIDSTVPELLRALLERAITADHGDSGIASVMEVLRQPAAPA